MDAGVKDWVSADHDPAVGSCKRVCNAQVLRRSEAHEFRRQLLPWTIAALLGALVPVLLWLVAVLIPGTIETQMQYSPLPCTFREPLGGGPRPMVLATAALFWAVGFTLSAIGFPTLDGSRSLASHLLLMAAIGGCLFVVPLLSVVWTLVIANGYASLTVLLTHAGSHGPLRRVCHLRQIVHDCLLVPWIACGLARLAFRVKPSREAMVVSIGSVVVFLALMASHYWLID